MPNVYTVMAIAIGHSCINVWHSDCQASLTVPCIGKNSCAALLALSIVEHGIRCAKGPSGLGKTL